MSSSASPQICRTRNPLFLQDIFHCILDCLVTPEASVDQFNEARPVLVSLAQICRAISEPSLDRLWYKLDSLEPLIRCYATVLDEERAKTPPSPSEWAIIHRYSYRIKELYIESSSPLSESFLRATNLYPSLLAPNLRALSWHPRYLHVPSSRRLSIVFIQRLLSPKLVSLNVSLTDTNDATLHSFLTNYPCLCPNLKSVTIRHLEYEETPHKTVGVLSRAITRHEHLESLEIFGSLNDVALMHIAMSPKLKNLSLMLYPGKIDLYKVCIPSDAIPFRNVKELSLEVWDLGFVTSLLRSQDQMFRSIRLCYYSRPTIQVAFSLLNALASHHRTHSLRSIRFFPVRSSIELEEWDESSMYQHLTYDTFCPLSSLRHLRQLIVDLVHWFSIDDGDFISLVRNWPFLQVLDVACKPHVQVYPWRWAKYVTLKGLLALLECCPDLRELSLAVDAREVPMYTGDVVCNPSLKHIDFSESPIGEVRPVQDVFARHFPSVTEVRVWFKPGEDGSDETDSYNDSWAAVNMYLQNIYLFRAEDSPS